MMHWNILAVRSLRLSELLLCVVPDQGRVGVNLAKSRSGTRGPTAASSRAFPGQHKSGKNDIFSVSLKKGEPKSWENFEKRSPFLNIFTFVCNFAKKHKKCGCSNKQVPSDYRTLSPVIFYVKNMQQLCMKCVCSQKKVDAVEVLCALGILHNYEAKN